MATIEIKKPVFEPLIVEVHGTSPLLQSNPAGFTGTGLAPVERDPWQEYVGSLYWLSERPKNVTEDDIKAGRFGHPSGAFTKALVGAAYTFARGAKKAQIRGAVLMLDEYVKLHGQPVQFTALARNKKGEGIHTNRARWEEWSCTLQFLFNPEIIRADALANLVDVAGWSIGVGCWRPERGGRFGRFAI